LRLIVGAAVLCALGIFLLLGGLGYLRKGSLDADGYIEQVSPPGGGFGVKSMNPAKYTSSTYGQTMT